MKYSLFIDEIKIHQYFCPFHHLNFIFLRFQLPGSSLVRRVEEIRDRYTCTRYFVQEDGFQNV